MNQNWPAFFHCGWKDIESKKDKEGVINLSVPVKTEPPQIFT